MAVAGRTRECGAASDSGASPAGRAGRAAAMLGSAPPTNPAVLWTGVRLDFPGPHANLMYPSGVRSGASTDPPRSAN